MAVTAPVYVPVVRAQSVIGARLRFRDATPDDAAFILALRLDPSKNRYLSAVEPDLTKQRVWLDRYVTDPMQAYFIIETKAGQPIGTVRLYDPQGPSFCWGSWILDDQAPGGSAAESLMMIYTYGLALGFTASHFDVRRGNAKVWQYHERLGAKRVGETDLDYFYTIDRTAIDKLILHYEGRFPGGAQVVFCSDHGRACQAPAFQIQ